MGEKGRSKKRRKVSPDLEEARRAASMVGGPKAGKNTRKRAKRRAENGMIPAEKKEQSLRKQLARSKYDVAPGTWIHVWRG